MNDIARIESAISFIPAIDRSLWVEVGMAVKSELGEAGRDIWDAWSRGAESYKPVRQGRMALDQAGRQDHRGDAVSPRARQRLAGRC